MKRILICTILFLLFFAAGPAWAAKEGGTLVVAMEAEPDILDPHGIGSWATFRLIHEIYDCLVHEDLTSSKSPIPLIPGLATHWDVSDDGRVYTFYLREGVKFHDGTPFDAEAVAFNIRRCSDKSFEYYYPRAAAMNDTLYGLLKETKVIDSLTIKLTFSEPFHSFIRLIASITKGSGGIVSPTAIIKYGQEGIANHPIGTGPFIFEERVIGEKIVLRRNPNYWGDKPKVERVIFRPMEEPATRINALMTGGADIICVAPPDSIEQIVQKGYVLSKGPTPHVWFLIFNFKNDIMKNKKVRQAINMAIDRKGIAEKLLLGTAKPAYGLLVPGDPLFDNNYKPYIYDPKEAKRLLTEAGYPNGFETTLQTSTAGSGQIMPVAIAEWIQRDLEKVGIKLKLETYEWITYLGIFINGMKPDIGMNQISWGFTAPVLLSFMAQTKYHPPGTNTGSYSNKLVDEYIAKAEQARTTEEYHKYYKMAHEQIMEDAGYCPVVHDLTPYLMSKRVKGFVHASENWFDCVPIRLED